MTTATRLYSVTEAAELLSCSTDHIRDLWNSGELAFVRSGKGRKVSDAEISRYILDHTERAS